MSSHIQYYQSNATSGDSKKLVGQRCSLGKNDQLISPAKGFFDRFTAKRVRNTSWHHSANSPQDGRYSFTYVFRHNVRTPEQRQLLIPTNTSTIRGVQTSEVEINQLHADGLRWLQENTVGGVLQTTSQVSATNRSKWIWTGDSNPKVLKTGLPGKTFYSPFCLQEMESLSWNINNFKIVPALLGHAEGSLPGSVLHPLHLQTQYNVDDQGNSLQVKNLFKDTLDGTFGLGSSSALQDQPLDANDSFATGFLTMKNYKYSALVGSGNSANLATAKNRSIVADINHAFNGIDGKKDLGRYKVQLGQASASFTFVNTGDSDMIVDMVVHRAKEDMMMQEINLQDGYVNTLRGPKYRGDIHDTLIDTYGKNYLDYHNRQEDRIMTTNEHKASDVDSNPKTKFLPTTYRTPVRSKKSSAAIGVDGNPKGGLDSNVVDPAFIDIKREKIIVPANCRKTLSIYMPAKLYDPAELSYLGCLNANGIAVTFGVTGKTTRAVIPAGTTSDMGVSAARFMGRQAAPTSFHIYGNESQVIYPVALVEKPDYQANNAKLPIMSDPTGVLSAAMLNPPFNRDDPGRYVDILVDGAGGHQYMNREALDRMDVDAVEKDEPTFDKRLKIEEADSSAVVHARALVHDFEHEYEYSDSTNKNGTDWFKNDTKKGTALSKVVSWLKSAKNYINDFHQNHPTAYEKIQKAVVRFATLYNSTGGNHLVAFAGTAKDLFLDEMLNATTKLLTDAGIDANLAGAAIAVGSATSDRIGSIKHLEYEHDGERRRLLPEITILGNGGYTTLSATDKERLARLISLVNPDPSTLLVVGSHMFGDFIGLDGNQANARESGEVFTSGMPSGGLVKGVHWDMAESVSQPHPNPAPQPQAVTVSASEITLINGNSITTTPITSYEPTTGATTDQQNPFDPATHSTHIHFEQSSVDLPSINDLFYLSTVGVGDAWVKVDSQQKMKEVLAQAINQRNYASLDQLGDIYLRLGWGSSGSSVPGVNFNGKFEKGFHYSVSPAPMVVSSSGITPTVSLHLNGAYSFTGSGSAAGQSGNSTVSNILSGVWKYKSLSGDMNPPSLDGTIVTQTNLEGIIASILTPSYVPSSVTIGIESTTNAGNTYSNVLAKNTAWNVVWN